jgi:hypothetical protein
MSVEGITANSNYGYGAPNPFRDENGDIKYVDRLYQKTKILCGRSHSELAEDVAVRIGIPLTKVKVTDFGNTEIGVEIAESVRGFHVYILQTGGPYGGMHPLCCCTAYSMAFFFVTFPFTFFLVLYYSLLKPRPLY